MKTKAVAGILIGLFAVSVLVAWQGVGSLAGHLAEGGWAVLLVCLFAPFDQAMSGEAWRRLFPPGRRPGLAAATWATWMGSAVNTLLPVATVGGEVVKARVLMLGGARGADAVSTMVVDKTAQAIVILLWALAGVAMLAAVADHPAVVQGALAGAALLALGIAGFVAVQVRGSLGFLARSAARVGKSDKWAGIVENAGATDDAIRLIYRRPGAIAAAVAWRLAGRVLLAGEVLLLLPLMGFDVTIAEAVLLKGLVVGLRGVSFAIPAGLGIQEGGYIAVGALIGFPPDLMLTLSLATRVREILPNVPFLFAWQRIEVKALAAKARAAGG